MEDHPTNHQFAASLLARQISWTILEFAPYFCCSRSCQGLHPHYFYRDWRQRCNHLLWISLKSLSPSVKNGLGREWIEPSACEMFFQIDFICMLACQTLIYFLICLTTAKHWIPLRLRSSNYQDLADTSHASLQFISLHQNQSGIILELTMLVFTYLFLSLYWDSGEFTEDRTGWCSIVGKCVRKCTHWGFIDKRHFINN